LGVGRGQPQRNSPAFPGVPDDPEFTSLESVCEMADAISCDHHFRLVQMPFNLLEPGAVLQANQPGGKSPLAFAAEKGLGVLINRPLNAFGTGRLLRLVDLSQNERMDTNAIIAKIRQLQKSETRLKRPVEQRDRQDSWTKLGQGIQ
jgi:hypothetical protein